MSPDQGWFHAFTLCVVGHLYQNRFWPLLKGYHGQKCFINIGSTCISARDPLLVAAAVAPKHSDTGRLEEHARVSAQLLGNVHAHLPGHTLGLLPLVVNGFEDLQAVRGSGIACGAV